MGRYITTKNTFKSGMISPKLYTHDDLEEHAYGAAEIKNMLPDKIGGVYQRPSTQTVLPFAFDMAEAAADYPPPTYIPFTISGVEESTSSSKDIPLLIGFPHTGILGASNFTFFYPNCFTTDGYEGYQPVLWHVAVPPIPITPLDITPRIGSKYMRSDRRANSFILTTLDNVWYSEKLGSSKLYDALDPTEYNYAQYGNTLILCHSSGKMAPFVFEYNRKTKYIHIVDWFCPSGIWDTSTVGWKNYGQPSIFRINPALRMPYEDFRTYSDIFIKQDTLPSVGSSTSFGVYTDQAATTQNNVAFTSNDVGRFLYIRLDSLSRFYVITIDTVDVDGQITGTIIMKSSNSGGTTNNFALSVWGGSQGFPKSATFYQERLIFGGCLGSPNVIHCSHTSQIFWFKSFRDPFAYSVGDWPKFDGDKASTDPFSIILGGSTTVSNTWLSSGDYLIAGSDENEYFIFPTENSGFSSEGNKIEIHTTQGSSTPHVVKIDTVLIFISRNGKTISSVGLSSDGQNYNSLDYTSHNPEILNFIDYVGPGTITPLLDTEYSNLKIIKLVYFSEMRTIFALTSDRLRILSFTFSPEAKLKAWAVHDFGSTYESNSGELAYQIRNISKSRTFHSECLVIEIVRDNILHLELMHMRTENKTLLPRYKKVLFTIPIYKLSGGGDISMDNRLALDHMMIAERSTEGTEFFFHRGWEYAISEAQLEPNIGNTYGQGTTNRYTTEIVNQASWTYTVTTTPQVFQVIGQKDDGTIVDLGLNSVLPSPVGYNFFVTLIKFNGVDEEKGYRIVTNDPFKRLFIGIPFDRKVQLLPANLGSQVGSGNMSVRRVDRINVSVYQSKGGSYSIVEEYQGIDSVLNATSYSFNYLNSDVNVLESMDFLVDPQSSTDRRQKITIEESDPMKPLNITAVTYRAYITEE